MSKYLNLPVFFILISFCLILSCSSDGDSNKESSNGRNYSYKLKGTVTTDAGDPLRNVQIRLPKKKLKQNTDDSGGFQFAFDSSEEDAKAVTILIKYGQKESDFALDISKYPAVPVRADFILNESNGQVVLEGITPDPGILSVDEATSCTSAGKECSDAQYCFFVEGDCGASKGVCLPKPEVCNMMFAPVCGCDSNTYSNDCVAARSGVSISTFGECGK